MWNQVKSFRGRYILYSTLLFLIAGCTGPSRKAHDGTPSLRFKNWWNFYEQGLTHLEKEEYNLARLNFEVAMGVRSGAAYGFDQDRWREVTYGLHVIEGYFPNRELGVVLYHLGKLVEAESFLQRSIQQTPSGRAKYYLNSVRRRRLDQASVAAPTIEFGVRSKPAWTREQNLVCSGFVRGEGRISGVMVHGKGQFIELARKEFSFSERIPLESGTNILVVTAEDLTGQITTNQQTWIADWQKPQLFIQGVEPSSNGWVMTSSFVDDHALQRVMVGDSILFQALDTSWTREQSIRIELTNKDAFIWIHAVDRAGNQLQITMNAAELVGLTNPRPRVRYASTRPPGIADAGGHSVPDPKTLAASRDMLEPTLVLKQGRRKFIVFDRFFFIDGWAEDGSGLAGIYIKGEQRLPRKRVGVMRTYFSRRVGLKEGENTFPIEVHDTAGNVSREIITVVYQVPEYEDVEFRLSVGVPPVVSENEQRFGQETRILIKESLAENPPRFHLLERDDGLGSLLVEHQISLSEISDPKARIQIGKLRPAELLLFGGIIPEVGGITILGKVVESSDGRVLCFEDVYTEDPDVELTRQVDGLVLKIESQFPAVEGEVTKISDSHATLNMGGISGIRAGTRFVAASPPGSPERDGHLRRYHNNRIELIASTVMHDSCKAVVIPREGRRELHVGDQVIAR